MDFKFNLATKINGGVAIFSGLKVLWGSYPFKFTILKNTRTFKN